MYIIIYSSGTNVLSKKYVLADLKYDPPGTWNRRNRPIRKVSFLLFTTSATHRPCGAHFTLALVNSDAFERLEYAGEDDGNTSERLLLLHRAVSL